MLLLLSSWTGVNTTSRGFCSKRNVPDGVGELISRFAVVACCREKEVEFKDCRQL